MLAIGIGVNVAAFGFVNAAFLKPLPIRDPPLLHFERRAPDRFASDVPYPEMAFVRDYTRTLSAVLAVRPRSLAAGGDGRPLSAQFVTGNFFTISARPRVSAACSTRPRRRRRRTRSPCSVTGSGSGVSAAIRRLSAAPSASTTVRPPSSAWPPPEFGGLTLDDPDVWLPLSRHPDFVRGSRLLTDFSGEDGGVRMWGRMRPGVTPAAAEEDLQSLPATLRAPHPDEIWEHERLASEPGGRPTRGGGSCHGTGAPRANKVLALLTLTGALVLLILAVACGNLGSLLLARACRARREMSIRIAVGAGSPRLIRQLFTESLLLACLGSLAGVWPRSDRAEEPDVGLGRARPGST